MRPGTWPGRILALIRRQTITAQVITHILGLIKRGEVKPGERLPTEKQLTEQLSVSRTCVREAIKSLQSLQLISVRPKIGAVVLEPSPVALINAEYLSTSAFMQQADSLIEFRKVLELGLVALAAEKATEADWLAMRGVLAEQEAALSLDRSTPKLTCSFIRQLEPPIFAFTKRWRLRPEILSPSWFWKPSRSR